MIVVVTGASGFVGRHLVPALAAGGIEVRPVVRRLSAATPAGSRVAALDKTAADDWSLLLDGADAVVHLAAHNPRAGRSEADVFRRVNVEGTAYLAAEASKAGVGQFIFASSVRAYGAVAAEALSEDLPLRATDPYGCSKAEAERALASVLQGGTTDWTILRPPAIYGPGGGGIPALIGNAVRRGLPLPFAGTKVRRSILYVGNFISAVRACLVKAEARGQVFNVADEVAPTYGELAHLIGQAIDRRERLFVAPDALRGLALTLPVAGGIIERLSQPLVCDTGRIASELGWSAPFTILDGLRSSFGKTGTI